MAQGQLAIGITVNFTIDVEEKQNLLGIYQKEPIGANYELNLINNFKTDDEGKIDSNEFDDYIKDSCLNFIHDQSIIGKILLGLDYSISIKDVKWEQIH